MSQQISLNQQKLDKLKTFRQQLEEYVSVTNEIYSVVNRHRFADNKELDDLLEKEKILRLRLNEAYGELEETIIALIGYKPYLKIPSMPGVKWDIFIEAMSGNFKTSTMGESQEYALQAVSSVIGKAKSELIKTKSINLSISQQTKEIGSIIFTNELIARINVNKLKILCTEMNKLLPDNPNSAALLMRTILLVTLRHKLGKKSKDELEQVLAQAISQDIYQDKHVKRILINFQKMPKTLLDATHHSQWLLMEYDDLHSWLTGLNKLIEFTFP